MIREELIEHAIERLSSGHRPPEEVVNCLKEDFPYILSYVDEEWMSVLFPEERNLLIFGISVLIETGDVAEHGLIDSDPEEVSEQEEENWSRYDLSTKDFHERLDTFFEDYPEEDLLAFVEDLLTETEEDELTDEGRDVVFIALKTLIDLWYVLD